MIYISYTNIDRFLYIFRLSFRYSSSDRRILPVLFFSINSIYIGLMDLQFPPVDTCQLFFWASTWMLSSFIFPEAGQICFKCIFQYGTFFFLLSRTVPTENLKDFLPLSKILPLPGSA